jgi:flagellar biosynthesis/type III secretory pathway chaperone
MLRQLLLGGGSALSGKVMLEMLSGQQAAATYSADAGQTAAASHKFCGAQAF